MRSKRDLNKNLKLIGKAESVPYDIATSDQWPNTLTDRDFIDVNKRVKNLVTLANFKGSWERGYTCLENHDQRTGGPVMFYLPYKLISTESNDVWDERFEEIMLRQNYAEAPDGFQWQFDYSGDGTPLEPKDPLYNKGRYASWWDTEFPEFVEKTKDLKVKNLWQQ